MRNPALFLLTCFLFVSLFNLPLLVSSQSNPQVRNVFQVTDGSTLYSQASNIIHWKPSAYTGSPWNFNMNDLYDSNLYFRKSAYFWVRHNFTSAPASEVRLVRAASTIAKAPVISTDAHFMVTLTWNSGNIQINLVYPVTGTTPVTQTLTSNINLKAYTWYGVFISRNVLAGSDQGALFVYDPSTVSGSVYNSDLQAPAAVAPAGYSSTSATSNFYIDIGGDTQISSPSNCEIANFNFLYKIDFYNTASAILELIKQPPRLVLWLEYKEMDDTVQLVMDSSNANNVVFRGDSQFDTNRDSALNSDTTTNADVGHIYSQNGFDTIYPAFDLGQEYAISFWTQFNTRPSTVTTDTNQIVFFKQNSQYSKMQIRLGFQTSGSGATITNFVLQSGNTVATPSLTASITRGDGNWYYFYIYMASFYKNATTTGPTTFHPTTLYTIRYTTAAGTVATTLSGIINDYFIHGGTTDAMRIGMGVDGQNEYFYGVIKQFQVFTGGWNFDVSSDPSSMVVGGANTIHITDGVLSTRVFSQICASTYQLSENDCVATCPSQSYQVTADTNFPHCEDCYENCLTCTGRKDQMCQSCVYGNWLPFGYVNCPGFNPCNIHQYDTGTYCQECMNECASCKGNSSCTACIQGYAYNLATYQCEIATCGDGVVDTGEQCDDGNQFNGDGCSTSCTIEQGFYCPEFGGTCYSVCGDNIPASNEACDDGNNINGDGCNYACQVEANYFCTPVSVAANIGPFYGASYQETCTTCGSNCKTCATASTCSVCATGYFLYGTSCVSSCPATGYYPNSTSQTCIACPSLCSQCTSNTVCTLCSGTNALLNSQCYDTCPDGMYSGTSAGIQSCLTCPSHCTTCSSSSSCYSCDDGWYLQNPGSSSGTCAQCDSTCETCRGSATTDCILCPSGRTLKTATSECVILSCTSSQYANTSIGVCQNCDNTCATCMNTLATGCTSCPSLNALTVNNMCFSCSVANNANGLYLIGTTCNDICGDGKRVMKTTGCDDGNTIDGDGCSSKCVVESGWSCSGGSETTPDVCVSLVGPMPIITVSDRDPTSFLISFDRQVINTLQPNEYVTQIVVALEGLDPDLSLYSISWDSTNQVFTVSFDLKESAVDSLLSVQFTDPSRITDAFSNQVSPALSELSYPAYYYVDPDTKKLADHLTTFSVVIQSINTASIIPLALTGYLNHYWLFLESFQVVHDLMLINVRTPYIAEKFFESFHYMRMNWLPNALTAANLNYNQTQQLGTDRFYDQEINSFYLENNGYQLTAWVFLLVVWLSLKIVIIIGLKNTRLKQLIYSIVVNLEWSIIIRAVVILYFDFCIYSFLQLTNMTRDTPAMTVSSVLAIVSTVFIGLFPIFCLYQTLKVKNQYLLTTDTRFDTLYREYKKRFLSTITFLTITLYQKALIAAFLVGLQSQPKAQIGLLAGQEILMLMLLLVIRPYVDGSMNFRAIIQELVMFAAFAMFYGLTSENTDENVRDKVGRVIVGLIIVALLMHLIFLIKDSYLTIKNHYKRAEVDKQIFGKVRITPQSNQDEFQLNNIMGENPDVSASDRNIIPKSQDRFSMEDGSPQNLGDQENTNFMGDHEQTNFRDTMSPATPVKESVFAYED